MTLTCGSESTPARCCVACWAFGSGSLTSGLGTWTSRTNSNPEESLGKPERSPLLPDPRHVLAVRVGLLRAKLRGVDPRGDDLGGDRMLKRCTNIEPKSPVKLIIANEEGGVTLRCSCH